MAARKKKPAAVREPIQVYLDLEERRQLDLLSHKLDVSRAEVLRRGIESLRREKAQSFYEAFEPLIGSVDSPDMPTDASVNLDEYLADALEAKWKRGRSS